MTSLAPDLVVFSKNDAADCKNWSAAKKRLVAFQVSSLAFAAVFGSSLYAAAEPQLIAKYGKGEVVTNLGLSLYVLGFSFGPILCPMSEMYGRRIAYLISWPLLVACCGPSAWINNFAVIIVFRFLAGCSSACALNNGAGVLTDMYMSDIKAQATAIALYACSVFAGPCIALPVGFAIAANAGPELWVLRVFHLATGALLPIAFLVPETHGPTILAARAARLRMRGRKNARAAHELSEETLGDFLRAHVGRPFAMLFREPIIQASAAWTALAYGITYLFFDVYPYVFYVNYGFQLQYLGLPFLAMVIGFVLAIVLNPALVRFFVQIPVPRWLVPKDPDGCLPEKKLRLSLLACALMPASLFWFAWSSGGDVHWIVPTLAGVLYGFAAITIFFVFLTYTAEVYSIYSNSANVCNSFFRSLVAAIFPLISNALLKKLGTRWGVSLFAFLSLGLLPIPLVFMRYGSAIRARSHYAQEAAGVMARMRDEPPMMMTLAARPRSQSRSRWSSEDGGCAAGGLGLGHGSGNVTGHGSASGGLSASASRSKTTFAESHSSVDVNGRNAGEMAAAGRL